MKQSTPRVKINKIYLDLYTYAVLIHAAIRYVCIYGGRRSGKSWATSQLLVRKALEHKRKIVCMRKVARTLRLSVFPRILAALDESIGLKYCNVNKSDLVITLPNGSVFLFVGADDPEKLKSLEGATDYWLEEATEFSEADLDTIDAGLSGAVDPECQVWMTFNPIPHIPGHLHWIQRRFDLAKADKIADIKQTGSIVKLRTTYKQNAFCPEAVKEVLEGYKKKNPDLYKMWALGEFVTAEGCILTNWSIIDKVPDGVPFDGYGLDFGYSNDPAALIAIWQHHDDLYLREDLYETGLTNTSLGHRMKEMGITHNDVIRADSAEPKSIAELKDAGFTVIPSDKGPDYKRAAAQWLRSKNIYIISGSTNLIREAASWSWDRDKHGNQLPKPADGDDHTVDATIYGAYRRTKQVFIGRA